MSFITHNVIEPFELLYCQTRDRRLPYKEWLDRMRDPVAYAAIQSRTDRLKRGRFGDCEPVGEGVWELRIDTGPGYRVYYARARKTRRAAIVRWRQTQAVRRYQEGKGLREGL